jgi:hypothetical protein
MVVDLNIKPLEIQMLQKINHYLPQLYMITYSLQLTKIAENHQVFFCHTKDRALAFARATLLV